MKNKLILEAIIDRAKVTKDSVTFTPESQKYFAAWPSPPLITKTAHKTSVFTKSWAAAIQYVIDMGRNKHSVFIMNEATLKTDKRSDSRFKRTKAKVSTAPAKPTTANGRMAALLGTAKTDDLFSYGIKMKGLHYGYKKSGESILIPYHLGQGPKEQTLHEGEYSSEYSFDCTCWMTTEANLKEHINNVYEAVNAIKAFVLDPDSNKELKDLLIKEEAENTILVIEEELG